VADLYAFMDGKSKFTQVDLFEAFGKRAETEIMGALNVLVKDRRIKLLQTESGEVEFEIVAEDKARAFKGLGQDHMLVLQEVGKVERKGIYKKQLKRVTGLPQAQLTRILKTLESRKLVKPVKTIASKTMNLYVLYDVAPAREHTGGPWYTDQEFDLELVSMVSQWMLMQIAKGTRGTDDLQSMTTVLQNTKIVNVELGTDDLKQILDKLIFEGKIEKRSDNDGDLEDIHVRWKLAPPVRSHNYLDQTPCGVCPVRQDCHPGGVISPTTCKYMDEWLGSEGLLF